MTWDEFRAAVTREPLILESFMSALPSSGLAPSDLAARQDVRNFMHRSNLTWRLLNEIWRKLKAASDAVGGSFLGEARQEDDEAARVAEADDEWSPNHIEARDAPPSRCARVHAIATAMILTAARSSPRPHQVLLDS